MTCTLARPWVCRDLLKKFYRTSNNTGIPFEPQSKRHSELQEIDQEVELGGHLIPKGAEILAWCSWGFRVLQGFVVFLGLPSCSAFVG